MAKETGREVVREREARDEEWMRCTVCGRAITRRTSRIDVDGAHVHTFVNPSGVEYTIGCYRDAPGCTGWGEESSFWSWFRGFAWRVVLCAQCGTHLGWSFRCEGKAFHGLVVSRIV